MGWWYSDSMELVILIGGFLGAWLLVAGSVYQAALELRDQDIAVDHLRAAGEKRHRPKHVSSWWWLLPPVKIILEKKSKDAYRSEYFNNLSKDDSAALLSFMNKATAWLYVGLGGLLIAAKETYELSEHLHVYNWIFFITVFVLLLLALSNTAIRVRRSERILHSKS